MAQQIGSSEEGFEDPNAGVTEPEPQEAGPGVMGKILSKFSNVKHSVSGHGSTPTTPRGSETQQQQHGSTPSTPTASGVETHHQHESNVEDLKDSPRNVESKVGGHFQGVPREQSPLDQVHNDAVGIDTAGAGGRVGDGVETSPVGAPSTGGSSRSVEAAGASPRGNGRSLREEGTPASPKLPRKDIGEKIMDKLPGTHTNPYSVGNMAPPQGANPYTEGDQSAMPTSPSVQPSGAQSAPGLFGKLKNMMTGQKPSHGAATGNATTGTAGTTGEQQPLTHGYTQSPTPDKTGDIFEKAKEKFGGHMGPDAGSADAWPAPTKPDIRTIPSATRTNAEGQPVEGPTQPTSEDTKKEGLIIKLMDKFHIHEKSSSPRATARDTGTGTPTVTTGTPTATRPSQETGIPTPTTGAPDTTIGTATGPTEN